MAVRSPLKDNNGNVKKMSTAEVDQIVDQIVYQLLIKMKEFIN